MLRKLPLNIIIIIIKIIIMIKGTRRKERRKEKKEKKRIGAQGEASLKPQPTQLMRQ